MFDVSHMGEVETAGADAEAFLQRVLSNDVSKLADGGAQYSVLCRENGGVLDDLFTYRLSRDRFLTVTNASNHEKDLEWMRRQARGFDVRLHDRLHDYAMLAVQGPDARGIVAALANGELPKRFRTTELTVADMPGVLVCGTGYTGEDGVELLVDPEFAPLLWDSIVEGGAVPAGLGARDTLRLEVCFHLYGNDLTEERGPIEAGLGWCCKEDTGFIGAEVGARGARGGPGGDARAVRDDRPGDRPAGQPGGRRRRSDVRNHVPVPGDRHRHGLRAGREDRARHTHRDRRPRQDPHGRGASQAAVLQGALNVADASYPDDLKYHPEHDWARIDGDTAVFGITWYAQDQLGEVVFVDPPEIGKTVAKDEPYAEIESVKAVSDVVAPLSGEIVEVNEALANAPEKINEDPYGDGWLVKVRLTEPSELDDLLDRDTYEGSLA